MKSLLQNKFLLFSVIAGVVVFALVVFTMLSLTATVKAAVLNEDISAGTTITESMVKEIDVPMDTPGDFMKSKESIIGQKAVSNIKEDQLIYGSNLMTAIDSIASENDEFIVTSMLVPDERALGGLLVAGDTVDISIVPDSSATSDLAKFLPDFGIKSGVNGGIYFILSNVKLLDTTTSVSSEQGSNLSAVTEDSGSSGGAYYLVSLSYNDYKKLRIAEQFGDIWLTMTPAQNETYAPLLEDMLEDIEGGLTDSSPDPITVAKKREAKKSNKASSSNGTTSNSDYDDEDDDSDDDSEDEESSDNEEEDSSSNSSSSSSSSSGQ